ncbi:hypothetical protein BJ322DRAFT_1113881 [Thelephora terrestris]|uniref:Galactose oxidase n=1 Tax=Thelephora terrestris TaxID=56493 RepID=A0A9P6H436_9AGAM|nr:hypothetical protein BJ322DRAFT_1113881 [Thelephora terrestris]
MFPSISTSILLLLSLSSHFCDTSAQTPSTPRWGQAHAIIEETLWVFGGKTDPYNQFSYTSAPNTNDLFKLDLRQSFDLSNPPWVIEGGCGNSTGCQGPLVAFHSLSAYDPSHMLLFGGQPDPNSNIVLPDIPDSAWTLNVQDSTSPSWVDEPQGWASEPSRRIYHSASSSGGKVFIIGGQKADGSQTAISQHESFDYSVPSFTALPTLNAPPDIYGHTSLVLWNGTLLVFGGYSQSQDTLLSFSTIWTLDTWADTLTWSFARIDNTTLPLARRNFAAVVLSDGRILIHGGSDAVLQTTYSDGWILDTTKDPMVWSQVGPLSTLGPRRDHMAVAIGPVVIFGFGYGSSGPASAPITVYDPSTGTWPSTYTPPSPSFTPINTFVSTPTSQPTSRTNPHSSTTNPLVPTTSGSGIASTSNSSHIAAIVIGVILGSLALVAVSIVVVVVRRRRRLSNGRFHMLGPSEDDENPHVATTIPVAQSTTDRHRFPMFFFGITDRRNSPQRRDMLADEDTRHFNDYSHIRDATHTSSFMEKPASLVRDSWASLRSVGALLGVNTTGSRRAPSSASSSQNSRNSSIREKDPFSDRAAFVPTHEGMASRPKGGSIGSEWSLLASQAHRDLDPFEDYEIDHYRDGDADAHSLRSAEVELDHTLDDNPPQSLLSQHHPGRNIHTLSNVTVGALPTVMEVPSYRGSGPFSESDPYLRSPYSTGGRSRGELLVDAAGITSTSLSNGSGHDQPSQPGSPTPTKASFMDANPTHYQPVKRSDSWWSRFTKNAFLDRRASDASSRGTGGGLNYRTRSGSFSGKTSMGSLVADFRDPNPAPKLVAIEENSPELLRDPSRQASGDSKNKGDEDARGTKLRRAVTTAHERIYSSTGHGKSISSLQTTNTEALEKIDGMDIVQRDVTESSMNSWGAVEGAVSTEFGARRRDNDGSANARISVPDRPLLATRRTTSSGVVASRVKTFENMEPKREPVKYGLAPRQPLFVANPDSRKTRSSDSV